MIGKYFLISLTIITILSCNNEKQEDTYFDNAS